MNIKGDFATTAARLAYVCQDEDIRENFRDLEDSKIYGCIKKGSGSSVWQSITDAFSDAEDAASDAADAQAAADAAQADADAAQAAADAAQADVDSLTTLYNSNRFAFGADRIMPIAAGLTTDEDKAYWQYLGYFSEIPEGKRLVVRAWVITSGTGASVAEMAVASSDAAPDRGNQTLTKIAAAAVSDDLAAVTGTIEVGLTDTEGASGHLWAGIRTAMATNEPVLLAVANDMGQGEILVTATSGALTGAGPWTGALITSALTAMAPLLYATIEDIPA